MDRQNIAQQTHIEHEMLRLIMEGLRLTAGWQVSGPNGSRKLSTLRFMAQSFQRHLERLLALEECDGYMDMVVASAPRLSRATETLRGEHELFRKEARQFVQRLERLSAMEPVVLGQVCDDLLILLDKIEQHSQKEMNLLQEAFIQEEGGEG